MQSKDSKKFVKNKENASLRKDVKILEKEVEMVCSEKNSLSVELQAEMLLIEAM